MKNSPKFRKRRGFTLVELLVVIAIIAVLAAAGFSGGAAAMNRARKVTAQAAATSIASSVEQFYSEYSRLPGTAARVETDSNGRAFLQILTGQDENENPRKIRFLSMKEGKKTGSGGRDGIVYEDSGAVRGIYDPWQRPYVVLLDQDYEEQINVSIPQVSGANTTLRGQRVAVYSLGVREPGDAKSNTLVKTW